MVTLLRRLMNLLAANWGWLKWLAAAGVLAFLFVRHREGLARLDWDEIDWGFLAAALASLVVALALMFFRWFLLVWAQEFPFGLPDALRLGMIGYLFNYVAPGAIGGDLVKATLIAREQPSRRLVAVGTIIIDRMAGLLGLLIVGGCASLIPTHLASQPEFQPIRAGFWGGTTAGIAVMALALHPAVVRAGWVNRLVHVRYIGRVVGELLNATRLYQARRPILVATIALSVLVQMGLLSSLYFCARALHGADVPSLAAHLQFAPAAQLFGAVIPLPAGTGALEGAMAYFYRLAGSTADKGFLAAIAYRLLTVAVAVLGAGYYLASRREIDQALHQPPATPETVAANSTSL